MATVKEAKGILGKDVSGELPLYMSVCVMPGTHLNTLFSHTSSMYLGIAVGWWVGWLVVPPLWARVKNVNN